MSQKKNRKKEHRRKMRAERAKQKPKPDGLYKWI